MTYEELKKAADELGYNLLKKSRYVKLLPCLCGSTRRQHRFGVGKGGNTETLICERCGLKGYPGATENEAKLGWNKKIEEEMA